MEKIFDNTILLGKKENYMKFFMSYEVIKKGSDKNIFDKNLFAKSDNILGGSSDNQPIVVFFFTGGASYNDVQALNIF